MPGRTGRYDAGSLAGDASGRAAARAADDDLGGEHAALDRGRRAGDELVEAVGRQHAELVHRLADGGQAGAHVACGHDVVPADDRDVVRDGDAAVGKALHDGEGELVVAAHEGVGGEVTGEQP